MKKLVIFLLPVCVLFGASSCNMEKRLYRKGWYLGKNTTASFSAKPEIKQQPADSADADEKHVTPVNTQGDSAIIKKTPVTPGPQAIKKQLQVLFKIKKEPQSDPIVKMSYAEARAEMAKKGCKPHPMAMTVYYMAVASAILSWLGLGIFGAIITLVISIFAIEAVVKSGSCIDENIAIIRAGRRICYIMLLIYAILTILVLALILTLIQYGLM